MEKYQVYSFPSLKSDWSNLEKLQFGTESGQSDDDQTNQHPFMRGMGLVVQKELSALMTFIGLLVNTMTPADGCCWCLASVVKIVLVLKSLRQLIEGQQGIWKHLYPFQTKLPVDQEGQMSYFLTVWFIPTAYSVSVIFVDLNPFETVTIQPKTVEVISESHFHSRYYWETFSETQIIHFVI